jgi:hypothetical protein
MPIPHLRMLTCVTTGVFFAVSALVAVAFPLHANDALTFGEWSRLIATHWGHVTDASNRPLFYVLQGSLWHLIGYSDTSGRLLCGFFAAVLVASLAWIATGRVVSRVTAALVVLFLLAAPVFANQVVSSLTDVVVASLLALTAACITRLAPVGWRLAAAPIAALLAVLAKPSALLALIGIGASQLLATGSVRERLLRRVVPLTAGTLAGFTYYVVQAERTGQSLHSFLSAGVTGPYYAHLAAATRRGALLQFAWFGPLLGTVLLFTLLYTVVRLAGAPHRPAVLLLAPSTAVLAWFLPWIGGREQTLAVGVFANASSAVSWAVSVAAITAAAWTPEPFVPTRRELAVFALWAIIPLIGWAAYATYDPRLLSPAWPGLLMLMAVSTTPALGALTRASAVALVPVGALMVAVALNAYNIDGLGHAGWDQWRRTPSGERFDKQQTRAIVLPAVTEALALVRPLLGVHGRLLTPEGSFKFYFPGRVDQTFPTSCSQLSPYRALVLTTDQGSRTYMQDFLHVSDDPSFWATCKQPHVRQLSSGTNGLAVFAVTS